MGLLSGISKAIFGDPSKDIRKASDAQLAFQQDALDYMKGVQAPVLAQRDQALGLLGGFYTDPASQSQFIDNVQASPFYQSMIDQGETAVLRNQAATGGLRSGTANLNLAQNSQNVLQGLVNQQLAGLSGLAQTPINTQGISSVYQNMGQNVGQAGIAQANAQQQQLGQLFGLGSVLGGLI